MTAEPKAILEIVDVFPEAIKVVARDLREGDLLFDAMGGTHEIVRITDFKHVRRTHRDDGVPDLWSYGDTVTIIRPTSTEV